MDFITDYEKRVNPKLITKLLREAVPVIKDIQFKYTEVKIGFCKSFLPLNSKNSNQHGTHQALLLGICGDYTGGLALATLIPHEPILGIHEISSEKGMNLWLVKSDMTYMKPSTDDVIVVAQIPKEKQKEINQQYHDGKTILFDVDVAFRNFENEDIAQGTFRYYCKKKSATTVITEGKRINIMYEHILKTSAKLIAQLRAMETDKKNSLFKDEISRKVAGKQGKVIADRFVKLLPELQNMVAARTYDLDKKLSEYVHKIKNIVFIGAGLDYRIYRKKSLFDNKNIFELDLPEMIEERRKQERIFDLHHTGLKSLVKIGCNFLKDDILEKLTSHGLNTQEPTFYIFEGCSMYFTREDNNTILKQLSYLLSQNKDSVLWLDMVNSKVFIPEYQTEQLNSFLSNMAKLGEPFVFGFDDNDELLNKNQLNVAEKYYTTDYISGQNNDIYSFYSFVLLKC